MTKQLTPELIMFKTKTNQLDKIKNLNLCANDLADISIVSEMAALEVLSLSVNSISTLKDVAGCTNLRELYIRRNNVESLNELRYLQDLPNLRTLWLGENPVAQVPGYRITVIKTLPQLQKLDNQEISAEEVKQAAGFVPRTSVLESAKPQQESQQEQAEAPTNSFAMAANRNRGGEQLNPNSTTPYYKQSPDIQEKKQRGQIAQERPMKKQKTQIVSANQKIQEDEFTRDVDLGNNYIRRGTGLARTPPRQRPQYSPANGDASGNESIEEGKSGMDDSKSPVHDMDRQNRQIGNRPLTGQRSPTNPEANIMWPSASSQNQPVGNSPNLRREQQNFANQNQRQFQHQSPQNAANSQLQQQKQLEMINAAGAGNMDPSQIQQLIQLQQMLLQQQQNQNPTVMRQQSAPVALESNMPSLPGFSALVQQQQKQNGLHPQENGGFGYDPMKGRQSKWGQQPQQPPVINARPSSPLMGQGVPQMQKKRMGTAPEKGDHPYRRDENILCAILALLKELDKNGLEFVVKDCNKRIAKMDNFQ